MTILESRPEPHQFSNYWLFALVFGILLALAGFAFGKPIWIDEFDAFAMGAYDDFSSMYSLFKASTDITVQTGVLFVIYHYLMKIFGASAFWLRSISIFSIIVCYLSVFYIFRLKRAKWYWPTLACITLFVTPDVVSYASEARPYMPLAGAVFAIIAYFMTSLDSRTSLAKAFGWFGVLFGVASHPYFSIYWFLFALLCLLYQWKVLHAINDFRTIVRFFNPVLSLVGVVLYFSIGLLTWLTHPAGTKFDPYQYIPKGKSIYMTLLNVHFGFLQYSLCKRLFFAVMVAFIMITFLKFRKQKYTRNLLWTLALMLVALLASGTLAFISYISNYWMIPRQWIASIAIVSVACIWFCFEVHKFLLAAYPRAAKAWLAILVVHAIILFSSKLRENVTYWVATADNTRSLAAKAKSMTEQELKQLDLVDAANMNIAAGGRVWKFFARTFEEHNK